MAEKKADVKKKSGMKRAVSVGAVLCTLIVGASSALLFRGTQETIVRLEAQIAFMEEDCVPLRFEVVRRDADEIEIAAAAYDCTTGRRTGESRTFVLRGEELFVDFQIIRLSEKDYVFFPSGLYTDTMALQDAEKLFSLYDDNGFPSIYKGLAETLSGAERAEVESQLSQYFDMIKNGWQGSSSGQFGTSVHDLKSVAQFKQGFTYKVLCHPHTGGIEIVKE